MYQLNDFKPNYLALIHTLFVEPAPQHKPQQPPKQTEKMETGSQTVAHLLMHWQLTDGRLHGRFQ